MRVKFNSLPSLAFSDATGVFSTARIERPLFHRGGSASTETIPAASPSHSEAARCASIEDHQAPSPPLFTPRATD
jgi:hypothetical protein